MILIYDGECEFCINCVKWIQSRIELEAIPYQEADLAQFLLSRTEASNAVHLVTQNLTLVGSDAVAYLLKLTHLKLLGLVIDGLRPLSRLAYKWVTKNRDSRTVRALNGIIRRSYDQDDK